MLQAHSLLWNYLWVAPNLLLFLLAVVLFRRGTWRQTPAFFAFAILSAIADLSVFTADVIPSVSPEAFWRADWAGLLIESFLKFLVFGEVFARVFNPFPSVNRTGRMFVSGIGASLLLVSALLAALARADSAQRLISGAHMLEQTVFFVESGVIVSLFVFAAYFHLSWDRPSFGILLGFGVSSCVHLGAWAISANANPSAHGRTLLDFFDMGTHHVCVLIWYYFLLIPPKKNPPKEPPASPLSGSPEKDLAEWNRELERLVHQ